MNNDLFHKIAWGLFILSGICGIITIATGNIVLGWTTLGLAAAGVVADILDYFLNYRR